MGNHAILVGDGYNMIEWQGWKVAADLLWCVDSTRGATFVNFEPTSVVAAGARQLCDPDGREHAHGIESPGSFIAMRRGPHGWAKLAWHEPRRGKE
ncbi:MAG: hypothetical protein ABI640_05050 [Gammaproteobacteria bacterium]